MADFFKQYGHVPYAYYVFSGTLSKPLDFCYWVMTPSLTAMFFGTMMLWAVALDRVFAIKYPFRYPSEYDSGRRVC